MKGWQIERGNKQACVAMEWHGLTYDVVRAILRAYEGEETFSF